MDGQRAGGLTVCGTRWACASEVAIPKAMGSLYHAIGTSRILEGTGKLEAISATVASGDGRF
jgi:hypothetical protein